MHKIFKLFALTLLVISCSEEPVQQKPLTPLVIKTTNGEVRFMVETANTPKELETGLMKREKLDFNSGMIFNIYPVRPVAMWMKNTKIPLDMLFVGPDASVIMLKENATPMSEELIICREPVRAVIELNAGQINKNAIKVGDKITHAMFKSLLDTSEAPSPAPIAAPAAPENQADAIPVPKLNIEKPTAPANGNGPLPLPASITGAKPTAPANGNGPLPLPASITGAQKAPIEVPKPIHAPIPVPAQ